MERGKVKDKGDEAGGRKVVEEDWEDQIRKSEENVCYFKQKAAYEVGL